MPSRKTPALSASRTQIGSDLENTRDEFAEKSLRLKSLELLLSRRANGDISLEEYRRLGAEILDKFPAGKSSNDAGLKGDAIGEVRTGAWQFS